MIVQALIAYVLDKLKDVSSASLESGFERLLKMFQTSLHDTDKNRGISFQIRDSQSQQSLNENGEK